MLFTTKESLEDTIIRLLSKGKITPLELYDVIYQEGKKVTVQAVYKALRYLIKASVIVKSGRKLEISQEWIDTLSSTFNTNSTLPQLANDEAAVYNYKSLVNLDAYWKHLMKALNDQFSTYPVFLYSPYNIWYHIDERSQSEADYYESFEKHKQYGFYVIGNTSELDKKFKNKIHGDYLQIDLWPKTPFKQNSYLTIIGDYIVDTILDAKITSAIESYFQSSLSPAEVKQQLEKVLAQPNKSKIKIERNAQKAKRLRKKLFKNFYLPKELKGKFNLF